jgi:hypothetical protein
MEATSEEDGDPTGRRVAGPVKGVHDGIDL